LERGAALEFVALVFFFEADFVFEEELGKGGFGTVYKGRSKKDREGSLESLTRGEASQVMSSSLPYSWYRKWSMVF
jgi:hypothetical protein